MMTFEEFDRRFLTELNPQQREAVLAVEGPVLILATPGSGKTTVLVTRLGYMILCCGIDPASILTMTYTRAATVDMRNRFAMKFGPELSHRLQFRTINGVSSKIISRAAALSGREPFSLLGDEGARAGILRELLLKITGEYPEDSTVKDAGTAITYIKNMLLSEDEIRELPSGVDRLPEVYRAYQAELRRRRCMDYDDQMVYALRLLQRYPEILASLQRQYRYLCVDEAQDTSKVQHEIIRLLASGSENLFMVGDEDQSIYAFRAACPDALLSFEDDHPGARVLMIEENYRSTDGIIEAANLFVAKNRFRHPKTIRPTRGSGLPVRFIPISDRGEQFRLLLKAAPAWTEQTAILYRNNDSALPLIDRFEAAGIPYNCRSFEDVFFSHRVVSDVCEILRFSSDQRNPDRFLRIYYKLGAGISKKNAQFAVQRSASTGKTLFRALLDSKDLKDYTRWQIQDLIREFDRLGRDTAENAVIRVWDGMGYGGFVDRNGLDAGKYFILRALAQGLPDIPAFLSKLDSLRAAVAGHENRDGNLITLSTVHSSKGLEYERVYLLDMLNDILPSRLSMDAVTESEIRDYEEERRIFYVAMTRAREELCIFIDRGNSAFPEEVERALRRKHPIAQTKKKSSLRPPTKKNPLKPPGQKST